MASRDKILIISTAYYPLVGGAEVAVKEITDRLGDQYDFDLLTAKIERGLPDRERIGNVDIYRLGWGSNFDKIRLALSGGSIAGRMHRQNNYQAVWAVMASFGGFAAENFKKNNSNVPYLLTLQEGDDLAEIEGKVRLVKGRFLNIFRRADYIQCISNYLAAWARRLGATGQIAVVPNGVDLGKFTLESESKIERKEKVIITTSRLVKKNGLGDLIKALSLLPPEIRLQIAGIGPEENELKRLVQSLGLANRVEWLGLIENSLLPAILSRADIFCRPSLSEGLGNSFLEAMAVGLPVIGTPVGGIPDFLEAGKTGWFCAPKNPASIALAVQEIINPENQAAVAEIRQRAKNMVENKYDWNIIAKQMGDIFHQLCQTNSPQF